MKHFLTIATLLVLFAGCSKSSEEDDDDVVPPLSTLILNRWNVTSMTTTEYTHSEWEDDVFPEYRDTIITETTNQGQYQFDSDQTGFYLNNSAQKDDFSWILSGSQLTANYTNSSKVEVITINVVDAKKLDWNYNMTTITTSQANPTPPNGAMKYNYYTVMTKRDAIVTKQ